MFKRTKTKTPSELDVAIEQAYKDLAGFTADSAEYAKISEQIVKLTELKHKTKPQSWVNPEIAAPVIGNLVGIGMIIGYERAHIITSKSLLFVKSMTR